MPLASFTLREKNAPELYTTAQLSPATNLVAKQITSTA